ncbi:MAG TPA: hypothetical protein VHX49_09425 [Candidatus Acidoferrales bacterium]|jgi:DNA-binding NtrC family response regulator|nr:hypothetical protein [Candidatus Acidoferrales bacterium]
MKGPWQIMVASSDLENRRSLVTILERQGIGTFCASNVSQCREILDQQDVGLVFCERAFADGDYRDVLSAAACGKPGPKARVVLLSALSDREQYRRAKEQGVFEVISAACRPTDVEWMVIQARRDEQRRTGSLLSAAAAGAVHEHSRGASA